jgi:hypothetical protein
LVLLLVYVPLPYSSAMAATSSRQKSGMSGTTRPQTRRETVGSSKLVSDELLEWGMNGFPLPAGVLRGVVQTPVRRRRPLPGADRSNFTEPRYC